MSYLNASWRGINNRDKEKRRPELGFRQSWTLALSLKETVVHALEPFRAQCGAPFMQQQRRGRSDQTVSVKLARAASPLLPATRHIGLPSAPSLPVPAT